MINTKLLSYAFAVIVATLLLPVANAEETPEIAVVPIVVVEVQGTVGRDEVTAIAEGLGAPYSRGAELLGRLGLVAPLKEGFAADLEAQFAKAQDDFFSGKHESAELGFEDIINKAHQSPNSLLPPSPIRELVFKAHIYRAIVARGEKKEEFAAKQIEVAAKSFLDLEPASVDFPPWVRNEFESSRKKMKTGNGKILLDAPEDCELELLGKKYNSSNPIEKIEIGDYALSVDCSGIKSPSQRLFVSDEEVVFRPIVLRHSKLQIGKNDLKLKIQVEFDEAGLEADLLSVARAGGWKRLVAIVGSGSRAEILLIDTDVGGVVRRNFGELGDMDSPDEAKRTSALASLESDTNLGVSGDDPWYKDGLAWTLVGAGLAAFGGGIAMAQIYGSPSPMEVWGWTLIAAGAGSMCTGVTLFFVPTERRLVSGEIKRDLAIGFTGYITF